MDRLIEFLTQAVSQYLWPALAVVVTFALAVLLHEFGHFLAARLSGVGVEIFSVGFGKRLWGIKRGGTDYRISAVPIGGYVKMCGIFSKETERYLEGGEGEGPEKPDSDRPPDPSAAAAASETAETAPSTTGLALAREAIEDARALRGKPWPLRVLVFASGCGFNFLIAIAAFALVAWRGVEQDAPYPSVVGAIKEHSPLYGAGLRRGDRIVAIDGETVTRWERDLLSDPPGVLDVLVDRVKSKKALPIGCLISRRKDGGEMLLMLTLPPAKDILKEYTSQTVQQLMAPCCIGGVVPFSPAHKAGIKRRDVILAIDNRPIESYDQMRDVVVASPGKPLAFRVKRGSEELRLTVTPTERGTQPAAGMIGVAPGNVEREWFKVGFFRSWTVGFQQAVHLTRQVAVGTFGLFARFHYREMKQSLAGPLGIFGMTYVSAREGWASFMFNMALLNIALMILNILPIPILDGGHILITTIESVTRRPVPTRLLAGIYYVFFALIISLLLMTTWFDVLRFAGWFGVSR